MLKLTDKNIKWIIRHTENQKDETTKSISVMYKISERRVQQIRKEYKDAGEIPRLIKSRRPKAELSESDKEIIKRAWDKQRVSSTRIEVILFSIATYLDRSSQARVMTDAGRGVAWISWDLRRNRVEAILFSIATYLDRSSQARSMTGAGRGVAWISWTLRRDRIGREFLLR